MLPRLVSVAVFIGLFARQIWWVEKQKAVANQEMAKKAYQQKVLSF